jgi:hypothetical protein
MTDEIEEGTPVSWLAMPYRGPVLDKEGRVIGITESLLGDEADDIFHGLVVKPESPSEAGHKYKELPGARVTRITTTAVHTDLAEGELESLPEYQPARYAHAEWGGLFRKHPKWKDEGPETRLLGD